MFKGGKVSSASSGSPASACSPLLERKDIEDAGMYIFYLTPLHSMSNNKERMKMEIKLFS